MVRYQERDSIWKAQLRHLERRDKEQKVAFHRQSPVSLFGVGRGQGGAGLYEEGEDHAREGQ